MKNRAFLFLAVAVVLLAVACETLVLERTALTAEDYYARGLEYLENGDYDSAIAEFTQAINLNPDFAEAYYNRSEAYYRLGNAYANYNWAIAYRRLARTDRANSNILVYTNAILLNPNDAEAYSKRGDAFYNRGSVSADKKDYDMAIADWTNSNILVYTQAIHLNPNDYYAFLERGYICCDKKDYDTAIANFSQAICLKPNDASAYNGRGSAYREKKDYNSAIADYDQAIKLNPQYALAYSNRGEMYYHKGDYDRAIADYEVALWIEPNDAYSKFGLENARFKQWREKTQQARER
jgi:tetratricopeptide (TPR) repeat protein